MIIKLTVHDNDFTDIVESFSDMLCYKVERMVRNKFFDAKNSEVERLYLELINKIRKEFNPNEADYFNRSFDTQIYQSVKEIIIDCWKEYVAARQDEYNLDINYLVDNFEVEFTHEVKEYFGNGEDVYYFATNNRHITF